MPYGSSDDIAEYRSQIEKARTSILAIMMLLNEDNKKEKAIKMLLKKVVENEL